MSALYAPEFQGGATLVVRALASELAAMGHACVVFSGRTTALEPLGAIARDRVDRADTVRVNVGGALRPWERAGYWNPVATAAFEEFLEEARPDLVHVHSLQGLGVGLVEAAGRRGVPAVVTMHDWWWLCPCLFRLSPGGAICPERVEPARCSGVDGVDFVARRASLEAALSGVARILVPSAFLRRSLVDNGIDGRRIEVAENGLPAPSRPLRPAAADAGPLRLAFLGGAGNEAKGLGVLLEAAAGLSGAFTLDAYSVGGEEAGDTGRRLEGRLRVHAPFAPASLDDVMSEADVVVVPSLMRESFSLVAREALMRGRPVVASDCGGPQDVVRNGENGLIVRSGSVSELTQALQKLIDDRDHVRALASRANLVPLTVREHAERTLSTYRDVLRAHHRPKATPRASRLAGRRVLFLTGMDGAPLRYRAWNLVERLGRAGLSGRVLYHSDVRAEAAARQAELVVLYRAPFSATVARVVADARRRGVPVLFSSDDFVFRSDDLADAPALDHPDPQVVAGYRESVEGHARCFAAADAFLGSTPELAAEAADLGLRSYCVPNGLSDLVHGLSKEAAEGRARRPSDDAGAVRLGFLSGTDTHDADLALVAPALAGVLERNPGTRLVLAGPVRTPDELAPWADRIERWPFVAWNDLPERLATLHVNLAPLDVGRPFNLGKSEVKLIEAAAVGVPTVASRAPAFVRASSEGRIARLCSSLDDWGVELDRLCASQELREALGAASRREVEARYGADAQAPDLVDALADLLERGPAPGRELPEPVVLEAGDGSDVALEPGDAYFDQYALEAESGGPLGPGREVAQTFTCRRPGLCRVDVRVGTYARRNEHHVNLALEDEDGATLASRQVHASRLVDRSFVSLELAAPLASSEGQELTLRVSAPTAGEGNEILVWHAPSERPGLSIGGVEERGRALSFRSFTRPDAVAA